MSEEIVTVVHREAARLLGVTTQSATDMRQRGVLVAVAVRPYRYALADVERLRAAREISRPKRLTPAPVQIIKKRRRAS